MVKSCRNVLRFRQMIYSVTYWHLTYQAQGRLLGGGGSQTWQLMWTEPPAPSPQFFHTRYFHDPTIVDRAAKFNTVTYQPSR